jgi:hypothetical protein
VGDGAKSEELLFTEPGWPFSTNALGCVFSRLGRRAGVPRLHPHLLRHTYACRYLLAHRDPLTFGPWRFVRRFVATCRLGVLRCDLTRAQSSKHLNVCKIVRPCHTGKTFLQTMDDVSHPWIVRVEEVEKPLYEWAFLT